MEVVHCVHIRPASTVYSVLRSVAVQNILCWLACCVHNRPPSPKFQIFPSQLRQTADRAAGLSIKGLWADHRLLYKMANYAAAAAALQTSTGSTAGLISTHLWQTGTIVPGNFEIIFSYIYKYAGELWKKTGRISSDLCFQKQNTRPLYHINNQF